MSDLVKAIRTTMMLGSIKLDVYQLPDGSYGISKAQTCEVVNLDRKQLSQLLKKDILKAIAGKGSSLSEQVVKMSYEGNNDKVDLIPLEMATLIWMASGSEVGKALAYSCVLESLERRADEAFWLKRTEEEWNKRLENGYRNCWKKIS